VSGFQTGAPPTSRVFFFFFLRSFNKAVKFRNVRDYIEHLAVMEVGFYYTSADRPSFPLTLSF